MSSDMIGGAACHHGDVTSSRDLWEPIGIGQLHHLFMLILLPCLINFLCHQKDTNGLLLLMLPSGRHTHQPGCSSNKCQHLH